MKYEIAYLSKTGNSAVLANAIAAMLPGESLRLTDLTQSEMSGGADINFIGFDAVDGPIPLRIMEALDFAEGRVIALFATCFLPASAEVTKAVERRVLPFVPCNCEYKGLFLCTGQATEETFANLEEQLKMQPDNEKIGALLDDCRKTIGHPNEKDLETLRGFIRAALSIM